MQLTYAATASEITTLRWVTNVYLIIITFIVIIIIIMQVNPS